LSDSVFGRPFQLDGLNDGPSLQSPPSADLISTGSLTNSPIWTDDELLLLVHHDLGPLHHAFHALELQIHVTKSSHSQYYSCLIQEDPDLHSTAIFHYHMDGGSQASTTDHFTGRLVLLIRKCQLMVY